MLSMGLVPRSISFVPPTTTSAYRLCAKWLHGKGMHSRHGYRVSSPRGTRCPTYPMVRVSMAALDVTEQSFHRSPGPTSTRRLFWSCTRRGCKQFLHDSCTRESKSLYDKCTRGSQHRATQCVIPPFHFPLL
jgi:hypothetical protein